MEKKIYIIENLCCANCGAKMERKINELPGVESATLTFATKQIAVMSNQEKNDDNLLLEIQKICTSIEDEVVVKEKKAAEAEQKADQNANQKKTVFSEHKKDILVIMIGAILFAAGQITNKELIFVVAYLLLGYKIVLTALKNLTKGHVFDENFLMSTATIAINK